MRLPKLPRPERYDLALHVDPAKPRFSGELKVALELGEETRALELHGVELEVDSGEAEDSAGVVKVAVRWNTVRCAACAAMSGMAWMPDEPVPMTATRFPVKSISSCGHLPVK